MSLQSEIQQKKKEIFTDGYPMSIGELIALYKEGELDIHPEFQRFFRWSSLQKSKLIESILLGIPLPSIFVSQRGDGVWDVVDGLQRLSTIFEFFGILKDEEGESMQASVLSKTEYLPSLEGKYWEKEGDAKNSFDSSLRLSFKREKIDIKIVKKESDDSIKYELFQRLNTLGSRLSDQEVRNCLLVMIDKSFYIWLKELAEFEPFLNTISLAERLMDEQYNMELALRFIILNEIDLNEIKRINDFSIFITDKMRVILEDRKFDRTKMERKFVKTFTLLSDSLGSDSFKKYVPEKGKFEQRFLIAAFEAVAIGLSKNIDLWTKPNLKNKNALLVEKVKDIWSNSDFKKRFGSGVNATSRVPTVIPVGEKILKP